MMSAAAVSRARVAIFACRHQFKDPADKVGPIFPVYVDPMKLQRRVDPENDVAHQVGFAFPIILGLGEGHPSFSRAQPFLTHAERCGKFGQQTGTPDATAFEVVNGLLPNTNHPGQLLLRPAFPLAQHAHTLTEF